MGKYYMGVDTAKGSDYSAYVVGRGLRWYDRVLRKLKLSKATWQFKVIKMWTEPPISTNSEAKKEKE